jgi:hypothetical protein
MKARMYCLGSFTCVLAGLAVALLAPARALGAEPMPAPSAVTAAAQAAPVAQPTPAPTPIAAPTPAAAPIWAPVPAVTPAPASKICLSLAGADPRSEPAGRLLMLPRHRQLQTCTYDDCEDQCTDCPWGCLPICLDVATCECGCRC